MINTFIFLPLSAGREGAGGEYNTFFSFRLTEPALASTNSLKIKSLVSNETKGQGFEYNPDTKGRRDCSGQLRVS